MKHVTNYRRSLAGYLGDTFSSCCRDGIYDTSAFLDSNPIEAYTLPNLKAVSDRSLCDNREADEDLLDARYQNRYGVLVGTVAFTGDELHRLFAEVAQGARLAGTGDRKEIEAMHLQRACDACDRCLTELRSYNLKPAFQAFDEVRVALHALRNDRESADPDRDFERIFHSSALAWQMLECAAGK